ncbi:MAG: sigma-70 family RNA polymerase sigma factor [Solirubrobacterales bacterium]
MAGVAEEPAANEGQLVARAQDGDMAAFEGLVMLHADRLYAALRRFGLDEDEAQEVAQETFLRAWRSLSRFEGRSQFFTWLYRIGFNEAQRKLGRRKPAGIALAPGEEGDPLEHVADEAPGPDERAEQRELLAHVAEALAELPEGLREPVLLRDVEGLSTADAASVLELGEAAFKSRLHRGRMLLRELLDSSLPPPRPGAA